MSVKSRLIHDEPDREPQSGGVRSEAIDAAPTAERRKLDDLFSGAQAPAPVDGDAMAAQLLGLACRRLAALKSARCDLLTIHARAAEELSPHEAPDPAMAAPIQAIMNALKEVHLPNDEYLAFDLADDVARRFDMRDASETGDLITSSLCELTAALRIIEAKDGLMRTPSYVFLTLVYRALEYVSAAIARNAPSSCGAKLN